MGLRKRVLVVGSGAAWLSSLALNLANGRSADVMVASSVPNALVVAAELKPEIAVIGASCVVTEGMNVKEEILTVSPGTRVIIAKD